MLNNSARVKIFGWFILHKEMGVQDDLVQFTVENAPEINLALIKANATADYVLWNFLWESRSLHQ